MKLFDEFEIVRFPEENLLLVTNNEYLYYIFNPKYQRWSKHKNAGNDRITINNYEEVTRSEVIDALEGTFPEKETDILRHIHISNLRGYELVRILREDYALLFQDSDINDIVLDLLTDSPIPHKSFLEIKHLLDGVQVSSYDKQSLFDSLKKIYVKYLGRNNNEKKIGIVDGHDSSSYFWIRPVKVIDYTDTNDIYSVIEMDTAEISIEEDDVAQYLTPFLDEYFDPTLEENMKREGNYWEDDDGNEHVEYIDGFEWYLTHNYYTFESVQRIIKDLKDTADALSSGTETSYTLKLREKRGSATYKLVYAKDLSDEEVEEYNRNRPQEDDTEVSLIVDFYNRLIYRLEYMLRIGAENGYNMISFMGP